MMDPFLVAEILPREIDIPVQSNKNAGVADTHKSDVVLFAHLNNIIVYVFHHNLVLIWFELLFNLFIENICFTPCFLEFNFMNVMSLVVLVIPLNLNIFNGKLCICFSFEEPLTVWKLTSDLSDTSKTAQIEKTIIFFAHTVKSINCFNSLT